MLCRWVVALAGTLIAFIGFAVLLDQEVTLFLSVMLLMMMLIGRFVLDFPVVLPLVRPGWAPWLLPSASLY